jgi:hypothetical protein
VEQLGVNTHGEVLEAGRVPDCYLGLLLDPADDAEAAGVLIVSPAALLHPRVPQPDGTVLYALLTGHPDRQAQDLVFLADLRPGLVEITPRSSARLVVGSLSVPSISSVSWATRRARVAARSAASGLWQMMNRSCSLLRTSLTRKRSEVRIL